MKGEKGIVKLYALEGMGFIVLTGTAMIILGMTILVGVPYWFIGRLVVRRQRKKRILAGETPPPEPSTRRKIVEACVSIFMSAVWFALVIFFITRVTYPFFANNPLPYTQIWIETEHYGGLTSYTTPTYTSAITICPLKKADFTTRELTATCNAAAKYYYGKLEHELSVDIVVCPEEFKPDRYYKESCRSPWSRSRSLGHVDSYCTVAQCKYDPDEKKRWVFFQVGVNADNMQPLINRLWIENENKFAADSLKKLIATELKLPPEKVKPVEIELKSLPLWILMDIPPAAPVNEDPPAEEAK